MEKCLMSVDWDYFVYSPRYDCGIYLENKKNLIDLWYKRYIKEKARGLDIQRIFSLSPDWGTFWDKVLKNFRFAKNIKVYVSDSHALSYKIAAENNCKAVYLFDSHADLGYGGLASLNLEVNCSNWLGKLLKDNIIKEASIIYGPHTLEKPEFFKAVNSIFNIRYCCFKDLGKSIVVSALHICRSGAWTPPWFDMEFTQFVNALGLTYEISNCPKRKWDLLNMTLSDRINYMLA